MYRLIFIFSCMFLLASAQFSVAQKDAVRVRVFDSSNPEPETADEQKEYDVRNYFHLNPYLLPRGAFTLGYERALNNNHAVSVQIGLTYRDFLIDFWGDDDSFLDSDYESEVKMGRYFEVAYKLYPKGYDDFDGGFYISPAVILKNYNISSQIEYYNGSTYETANVDLSYDMKEYALKFGYCTESWFFDDIVADVYFGVGMRQLTRNRYDDQNNALTIYKETKQVPALYGGVKIGFVF